MIVDLSGIDISFSEHIRFIVGTLPSEIDDDHRRLVSVSAMRWGEPAVVTDGDPTPSSFNGTRTFWAIGPHYQVMCVRQYLNLYTTIVVTLGAHLNSASFES